jgi:peroxiredoxin Q/BCP
MLEEGQRAPDFTLPDHDGEDFRLADHHGETLVLFFYPRADTPGCTIQACAVRDRRADYEAAGARVVGISPDPVEAVRAFRDKHDLGFTLLADADHEVADAFGTWMEKRNYGRTYWGVQRATFILAPAPTIARVFPKVSPKTHDDVVLGKLGELAAA